MTKNKEKKESKKENEKVKIKTIGFSILIFLVILLIFSVVSVYFLNWRTNPVINKLSHYFFLPASFSLQTGDVSIAKLDKRKAATINFYENQDFSDEGFRVDFSGENGEKKIKVKEKYLLEKLIEEKIIETLAKERGIDITKQEINQTIQRKLSEYAGQNFLEENIKNIYGWDLDDFAENIVKPSIYKERLEEFVRENDPYFLDSKESIEEAENELSQGADFSEVAKKYSQGESAKNGGELGWFSKDQVLAEITDSVFSLEKGETSEILQSSLGYHIILMEDTKEENSETLVKISQIFIPHGNFGDWLEEKKKDFSIFIPLPDMEWDKESGTLEFSDEEMKEFEKTTIENSSGDPLFMF